MDAATSGSAVKTAAPSAAEFANRDAAALIPKLALLTFLAGGTARAGMGLRDMFAHNRLPYRSTPRAVTVPIPALPPDEERPKGSMQLAKQPQLPKLPGFGMGKGAAGVPTLVNERTVSRGGKPVPADEYEASFTRTKAAAATEIGGPVSRATASTLGRVLGLPNLIASGRALHNPQGTPHRVEKHKQVVDQFSQAAPGALANTLVRLGGTDIIDDAVWKKERDGEDLPWTQQLGGRVWQNPRTGPIGKVVGTATAPITNLLASLTRSSHYSPETDTAVQFMDEPAMLEHELGHAIDFNTLTNDKGEVPQAFGDRLAAGTARDLYGLLYRALPPARLYHEYQANAKSQEVLDKTLKDKPQELHDRTKRRWETLGAGYGSYVGGAVHPFAAIPGMLAGKAVGLGVSSGMGDTPEGEAPKTPRDGDGDGRVRDGRPNEKASFSRTKVAGVFDTLAGSAGKALGTVRDHAVINASNGLEVARRNGVDLPAMATYGAFRAAKAVPALNKLADPYLPSVFGRKLETDHALPLATAHHSYTAAENLHSAAAGARARQGAPAGIPKPPTAEVPPPPSLALPPGAFDKSSAVAGEVPPTYDWTGRHGNFAGNVGRFLYDNVLSKSDLLTNSTATTAWDSPAALGLGVPAAVLGGLAGYAGVGALVDDRRESEQRDEIARARELYQQTVADRLLKRAADELDGLAAAYGHGEEKAASNAFRNAKNFLEQGLGAYLAYAALAAGGAGALGYQYGQSRSDHALLQKAMQERHRRRTAGGYASPARPDEFVPVPVQAPTPVQ
jgi:hypothetical protein